MRVYIVFGDTPRSDGENIMGVYATKELAEAKVERLKDTGLYDCINPTIDWYEVEE